MLKRILVPLDTSELTSAATRMAATLARREEADAHDPVTVTGLGLVDVDQLPTGRFASVVPRDEILAESEAKARDLVETFQREAQAHGMAAEHVEAKVLTGSPFRCIIRESVFCDLIVMGETCSFPPSNQDYETLHHLYHEASRPLVVTDGGFSAADTVVMLMDGTAPASRMMYHYLHLAPFPRAKVVLTYSRQEEAQYRLQDYFERVVGFLRAHHLNVSTHPVDGEIESEISGVVREHGAQVLALGAHREHFLDRIRDPLNLRPSFARRLMACTPTSLFLVH